MRPLLACLLAAACCPAGVGDFPGAEHLATRAQFSIVRDGRSVCCAVAVGPRLGVTADHCAPEATPGYAAPDGAGFRTGRARVVRRDHDTDLVLLELDQAGDDWLPIPASAPLHPGAPVWTRNGWATVLEPNAWVRSSSGSSTRVVLVAAPPLPGMSGSALVDRFGRLAGLCRGSDASGQWAAYAPATALAAIWAERSQ